MRALSAAASVLIVLVLVGHPVWGDEPAKEATPASPAKVVTPAKRGLLQQAVDLIAESAATPSEATPTTASEATHEQLKTVSIKGESGGKLQTLSITPDGTIIALVGPGRVAPIGKTATASPSEICLLDADGSEVKRWTIPFTGHSVASGPDGLIYVAGDGRLAKYTIEGELQAEAEVPHLVEALKDEGVLRQRAEEQLKASQESLQNTLKVFQDQVTKLEAKPEEERSEAEKQQLQAYKANLKAYDQIIASQSKQSVEQVMQQLTSRLRIINGITVTDKDVFIACGEMKGYGYAIWRMDLAFQNPERVLGPVSGCCGQMDIQARGDELFVAENTKHRVARYDREGKPIDSFGKSGRVSEGLTFGGCCNPMNCRLCADGSIYTAESEGLVKKFNEKGEFVAFIGQAKLAGGCKNVAVAASPTGERVYFCDLPGSRVIILETKKPSVAAGE